MPAPRITHLVASIDVDEHRVWRCVDCHRTWLAGFRWPSEYEYQLCPVRYDLMCRRSYREYEDF